MVNIIFTCGDINGIGPEVSLKSIRQVFNSEKYSIIFICPENIFEHYRSLLDFRIPINYCNIDNPVFLSGHLNLIDLGNAQFNPGMPTDISGKISLAAIELASKLALSKKTDGIVTAPISKISLEMAGINFPGHTEILADICNTNDYGMMFLSDNMKAALTTIHIPLKDIPANITENKLFKIINLVVNTLKTDIAMKKPKIAVLSLNPHGGENGRLGKEEEEIIAPVIKTFPSEIVEGPFVPDAFFGKGLHLKYDAVVGMYHDQVLIPFKMLNFDKGVNFTAGLPIVRTSPDHGTAFDISGKLQANPSSTIEAFKWNVIIAQNRKIKNAG